MGPASHLAFLKSSIIGGLRADDEFGSADRERPQMKSVNGMCADVSVLIPLKRHPETPKKKKPEQKREGKDPP
jgi:hypothetical protein